VKANDGSEQQNDRKARKNRTDQRKRDFREKAPPVITLRADLHFVSSFPLEVSPGKGNFGTFRASFVSIDARNHVRLRQQGAELHFADALDRQLFLQPFRACSLYIARNYNLRWELTTENPNAQTIGTSPNRLSTTFFRTSTNDTHIVRLRSTLERSFWPRGKELKYHQKSIGNVPIKEADPLVILKPAGPSCTSQHCYNRSPTLPNMERKAFLTRGMTKHK
jgi:hypothetical protein